MLWLPKYVSLSRIDHHRVGRSVCPSKQCINPRYFMYTPSQYPQSTLKSDMSQLHGLSFLMVSKPHPALHEVLLDLEAIFGRKVTLHSLHFMLRNNVDGMHGSNSILLIKDLFAIHIRCHRPRVACHICLVRSSNIQVPLVLRCAQARKYIACVVGVGIPVVGPESALIQKF